MSDLDDEYESRRDLDSGIDDPQYATAFAVRFAEHVMRLMNEPLPPPTTRE